MYSIKNKRTGKLYRSGKIFNTKEECEKEIKSNYLDNDYIIIDSITELASMLGGGSYELKTK